MQNFKDQVINYMVSEFDDYIEGIKYPTTKKLYKHMIKNDDFKTHLFNSYNHCDLELPCDAKTYAKILVNVMEWTRDELGYDLSNIDVIKSDDHLIGLYGLMNYDEFITAALDEYHGNADSKYRTIVVGVLDSRFNGNDDELSE